MSRRTREPRQFTMAEIEAEFMVTGAWMGERWCPAVYKRSLGGFDIRVLRPESGRAGRPVFDYFMTDDDGTITIVPWGHTKDYKPGRIVDIEAAIERYATPDPDAPRLALGGGR